ncbi:hypothetical protein HHI36_006304 [Cryptolaemus montrouzieri]|uniref:Uncharacterized protein n=1 Tax=Cryptolaemus montrouzieri TaxID=559131 RepID=A0ABD2NXR5_9CUCU
MAKILTGIFLVLSAYLFIIYQFQNVSSAIPLRTPNINRPDRRNFEKLPQRRSNSKSDFIFSDFLDDDEFELSNKRQIDDYGHMRFGKRGEDQFDDYGHMRFGRSI